jgi:hypothetical protein
MRKRKSEGMRSERPFSAWHVFVTFFALMICGQMMTMVGAYIEHPGAPTWALVVAWSIYLLLGLGAVFLVRELWREFRMPGSSPRARLR